MDDRTQDFMNQPIDVEDACSMYRVKIQKNERPWSEVVLRLNNAKVDDWKNSLLKKIAINGKIPASKVHVLWTLYEEGFETKKSITQNKTLFLPNYDLVMRWKEEFETKSIEDLYHYGPNIIATAWMNVCLYIRLSVYKEKWEKIYSLSDDPVRWYEEANKHFKLFNEEFNPFWDQEKYLDVFKKVNTILTLRIHPR